MADWVMDAVGVTYPDGKLQRVVFRKSKTTGELQINEAISIDVLGHPAANAIKAITEAKAKLIDAILLSNTRIDEHHNIIVDLFIDGWRGELTEFEKKALADYI